MCSKLFFVFCFWYLNKYIDARLQCSCLRMRWKFGSCWLIIEIEFSTQIYLVVKVNDYIFHGYKKALEEFFTIPNPPLKCPKYKYLLITINVLVFVIGLFIYFKIYKIKKPTQTQHKIIYYSNEIILKFVHLCNWNYNLYFLV